MRRYRFVLYLLLLLVAGVTAHAQQPQWRLLAQNIMKTSRNTAFAPAEYGSIKAKDSVILAGWANLVLSTDYGATWTTLTTPPIGGWIGDVDIWDVDHFAFVTRDRGAFYTTDRGNTWNNLASSTGGHSILYDFAPDRFILYADMGVVTKITLGSSPIRNNTGSWGYITVAADSTYRISAGGSFYYSTDHGVSWIKTATGVNYQDCNTSISDQTDPNIHIVINENWAFRNPVFSQMFRTTDNGATWNLCYKVSLGPFTDLKGNSTRGCHDYFVGQESNGILRSSDQGVTWTPMVSPVSAVDSHNIFAVDDSLLYVIDTLGSIWGTAAPGTSSGLGIQGQHLFKPFSLSICDTPIYNYFVLSPSTCRPKWAVSAEIDGQDISSYLLLKQPTVPPPDHDTIYVRFNPVSVGAKHGRVKLTLNDGSITYIDLDGSVSPPTLDTKPSRLFTDDTIDFCSSSLDSLLLKAACPVVFSSVTIIGQDASSFVIVGSKPKLLPSDSMLRVLCSPKRSGMLHAFVHLVGKDGGSWDVPLDLYVRTLPFTYSPTALFAGDTIAGCNTRLDSLIVHAPCPTSFLSVTVLGPDSLSYAIAGNKLLNIPSDSVLRVLCTPHRAGRLHARLHIIRSDGGTIDLPLDLDADTIGVTVSPLTASRVDTIYICQLHTDSILLHAPCTVGIGSFTISGPDSASFRSSRRSAVLPEDSLVRIVCDPIHTGDLTATVHIATLDGRSWDVPLHVVVLTAPIAVEPPELFRGDTLYLCSRELDSLRIVSPCPFAIDSATILGPDSASFTFTSLNGSASDSLVRVLCTPRHDGTLTAYVHVVASDGRTEDIPLSVFVSPDQTIARALASLQGDTLYPCQSRVGMIELQSPCSNDIVTATLQGQDAALFSLSLTTAHLPQDSLLTVDLVSTTNGRYRTTLHLEAADGRTWDFPIDVFRAATQISYTPAALFRGDTLSMCVGGADTIVLRTPCPLSLSSMSITGVDAASYTLLTTSTQLPADSVVIVRCTPKHLGMLDATLHVIDAEGGSYDISLAVVVAGATVTLTPAVLFDNDSLSVCTSMADSLSIRIPCSVDLTDISVTGPDASSFVLTATAPLTVTHDSTIVLTCVPVHPGKLDAKLHMSATDGRSWDVPLAPFVNALPTVFFDQRSMTPAYTDTVGGDAFIPIVIEHTGAQTDVEFTINFDPRPLVYRGVFNREGRDVTIGHPSVSKARVRFNTRNDTTLEAYFSFYPVDSACTHVTIDSVTGANGSLACLSVLSQPIGTDVCSPTGCAWGPLANYLRFHTMPNLTIVPNPANTSFILRASERIEHATVEMVDVFGTRTRVADDVTISRDGLYCRTDRFASGVYETVVTATAGTMHARVVVMR